jgi:hypothetical protein
MLSNLNKKLQSGTDYRFEILSSSTRSYDLWYKNINLKDIELSWISYLNDESHLIKRDKIILYKRYIKKLNEYILKNTQMTVVDTPYYSYYIEVNQYLTKFVNNLKIKLDKLEGKSNSNNNDKSDYEEIEIDDNNLFIKKEKIIISTKDEVIYIDFKQLSYTKIIKILYFIYKIKALKSQSHTNRITKNTNPKNPYFDDITLLNKFISKHCLNNGRNFNEKSIGKFLERSIEKYDEINPVDDNSKKTYLNEQPSNINTYVYDISFTLERQFKENIGIKKYYFDPKLSYYLKSENLIELLKLMNKTFNIV